MGICTSTAKVAAAISEADLRFSQFLDKKSLDVYGLKCSDFTQMWMLIAKAGGNSYMKAKRLRASSVTAVSDKLTLDYSGKAIGDGLVCRCSSTDEDVGQLDEGVGSIAQANLFQEAKKFPLQEEKLYYFPNAETGKKSVKDIFGDIFQDVHVTWNDFESDHALTLLAFNGLGMYYLSGDVKDANVKDAACKIDLSFLAAFNTRPSYERYGCIVYFSEQKVPLCIYWSSMSKMVYPTDAEWNHVKFVFRSSLSTAVTVKDHLLYTHFQVSNTLLLASRQSFGKYHPVRRLTKPHIYRAANINWGAKETLLPVDSLAFRTFAFDAADFPKAMVASLRSLKMKTFPAEMEEKKLPASIAANLSYKQDGEAVWKVIHKYVSDYLDIFYADDAAVLNDPEIVTFYSYYSNAGPNWIDYGVGPLSKASLYDLLTRSIFDVTAGHELLGGLVQYALDPRGLSPKIGKPVNGVLTTQGDIDSFYIALSLLGLTVMKVPMLIDDWAHIHLHEKLGAAEKSKLGAVVATFQFDLNAASANIDGLNKNKSLREIPFEAFNPKYLECSVSV